MTNSIKVVIAEPNPIVRLGLEALLKKLPRYKIQVSYVVEEAKNDWNEALSLTSADIYILNPIVCGLQPRNLLPPNSEAQVIAIQYGGIDASYLKPYDGIIGITDSVQAVGDLFDKLVGCDDKAAGESQDLTAREREIVICVVKGMTNKRIAEHLFLSTHTVITHRRNIGKKLQIHSASALAVYAIANKLINASDLNVLSKDSK